MLSFPGAEQVVEAIHEELRGIFPAVPPCIVFGDEPSGDFGIAHFLGASPDPNGKDEDFFITFDQGRIPARYVVCHEIGHAISANVTLLRGGDGFTNGLYDAFWSVRGFTNAPLAPSQPWTPAEAEARAEATAFPAQYRLWPEENFADAFGAINSYGQGTLITETYGAALNEAALRAFYMSLQGRYEMLSEDELNAIAQKVANFILPEVLTKIDSGFNNTVAVELRRIARGHEPTVAGNDGPIASGDALFPQTAP